MKKSKFAPKVPSSSSVIYVTRKRGEFRTLHGEFDSGETLNALTLNSTQTVVCTSEQNLH